MRLALFLVAMWAQAKSKVPLQPNRLCGIQCLEMIATLNLDGSWLFCWDKAWRLFDNPYCKLCKLGWWLADIPCFDPQSQSSSEVHF